MPRLEDSDLMTSASKFKKRRVWIPPEGASPAAETIDLALPTIAKKAIEDPLIATRVEHDCNMSITRLEHDYNMSVTRVEQEIPLSDAVKQMSEFRVEHDCNMSVTRVEHECNKSGTNFAIDALFAFIDSYRALTIDFDDEPRCLILNLSDTQKQIFWHIAIECMNRNASRTGPIEIKSFFGSLAISTAVVRTTLNRLVDKRIIQREKGKLGKNGYAIISLPKMMLEEAREIFADFKSQI